MDDKNLWKKYIKTVTPIHKATEEVSFEEIISSKKTTPLMTSKTELKKQPTAPAHQIVKNYNKEHTKKAEKNLSKSMRRGEFSFDAKIDLHGFSQDQAYDALSSFIENHYFQNKRHLLIITGKGKFCYKTYQNMGILKPKLPEWFYDSHFAKYISVYQKAASRDGGDGAYYIILRKKN